MHLLIALLQLPQVEVASHTVQQMVDMFLQQLPAIITSLAGLITVVLTGRSLAKGQAAIAVQANDAATKADKAAVIAQATHILVNSDHGVTLRLVASDKQRIADLTGDPVDQRGAVEAKKASDDHEQAQQVVNEKNDNTDAVQSLKEDAAPPLAVLKEVLKK